MSQANVKLIQDMYAAFARGDGPAVLGAMDPTIVWNEAENFPYADRNPYSGPAAVAEGIFSRLATEWDNFQANPAEFLDAGDTVVVTGRYTATYKASNKPFDAQFAHFWRVNNDKVVEFHQYTDTAQAQRVMNTHVGPAVCN
jgi:ketosteroid isomerase-like protein